MSLEAIAYDDTAAALEPVSVYEDDIMEFVMVDAD